jgi:hypothetical protein
MEVIFVLITILMVFIKLFGVVLLVYVDVEVGFSGFKGNLLAFVVISVVSVCLPLGVFVTVYVVSKYFWKTIEDISGNGEEETNKTSQRENLRESTRGSVRETMTESKKGEELRSTMCTKRR